LPEDIGLSDFFTLKKATDIRSDTLEGVCSSPREEQAGEEPS
jgi:hypothetical protein